MDSLVPTITPPLINIPVPDKTVVGFINHIANMDPKVKVGTDLLLDIFFDDNSLELNNIVKTKLGAVPVDIHLEKGKKVFIPNEKAVLELKIISVDQDKANVKLVSVNKQPIEKFLVDKLDKPVVKNSNEAVKIENRQDLSVTLKTYPLKLSNLTNSIVTKLNVPDVISSQINDIVKNIEIPLELKVAPKLDISSDGIKDKISMQTSANNLDAIIKDFVLQVKNNTHAIPKTIIENFVSQLKNEVMSAKNFANIVKFDNVLKTNNMFNDLKNQDFSYVIKTPLGDFIADSHIKFDASQKFLASIKDFVFKNTFSEENNQQSLLKTSNIIELLSLDKKINIPFVEKQAVDNNKALFDLVKIFEPLKNSKHDNSIMKFINKVPDMEENFLPNLVSYIKAAQTGDVSKWISPKLSLELENLGLDGKEVLAKIQDFVSNSVKDGLNWRVIEVPVFNGDTLAKIKVSIKNLSDDDGESNNKKQKRKSGTRFVLDTNFSRLGSFQFDGFATATDKRFDLVIRTSEDIGDDIYSQIYKLFKNTLYNVGYIGNLNINVKENFIKICENDGNNSMLEQGVYI